MATIKVDLNAFYGYGHGVGMSQVGAMTMAKNGKTYEETESLYQNLLVLTQK